MKQGATSGVFVIILQPSSAGLRLQGKIIGIILTHKLLYPIPKLGATAPTVSSRMDIARIMKLDISVMNTSLLTAAGVNGWIETILQEMEIMKL